MAAQNLREQVEARLDALNDQELSAVLHYIEAMQSTSLPEDYDEANDPSIGFLSGPIDLASRSKQILHDEITRLSGWTQKKD